MRFKRKYSHCQWRENWLENVVCKNSVICFDLHLVMLVFFPPPEWNKADAAWNKRQREGGWQAGVCCQKEGKRRGCLDRTGEYSANIIAHYDDVIMAMIVSHITSRTIVYSIVYSHTDQRKHQSSASLAFVRGIHRDRWTNGQLRGSVSIWWRHHALSCKEPRDFETAKATTKQIHKRGKHV